MSVDVIIPVYRPTGKLKKMLAKLVRQTYPVRQILLLHTEDGKKLESFLSSSVREIKIKKEAFDHGGTRDLGMRMSDAEIVLFMTQDAVPENEFLVEKLVSSLKEEKKAAVAYARQIADGKSDILEKYTRAFNYPKESRVKSKEDLESLGIKTFFCSNVCAAYRRAVYLELGGFEKKIIFNEDMLFAAKAVQSGWKIIYNAEAVVRHSHHYTCRQHLKRNFDQGVSQVMHPEVFEKVRPEGEGIRMVEKIMRELIRKRKFSQVIWLVIESGFKYTGYQLGRHYRWFPRKLVLCLTMNQNYWRERRKE